MNRISRPSPGNRRLLLIRKIFELALLVPRKSHLILDITRLNPMLGRFIVSVALTLASAGIGTLTPEGAYSAKFARDVAC
jgi:hypothetical protein